MDTIKRLSEISRRLEQLENCAEWIARETAQTDNCLSQTGTTILVFADDIRERVYSLVRELETQEDDEDEPLHFH